jgi:hypothetical protein
MRDSWGRCGRAAKLKPQRIGHEREAADDVAARSAQVAYFLASGSQNFCSSSMKRVNPPRLRMQLCRPQ